MTVLIRKHIGLIKSREINIVQQIPTITLLFFNFRKNVYFCSKINPNDISGDMHSSFYVVFIRFKFYSSRMKLGIEWHDTELSL